MPEARISTESHQIPALSTSWTSSTATNTVLQYSVVGFGTVAVALAQTTTITGGVVTFEVSDTDAGTNWYPIVLASFAGMSQGSTYTLAPNTNIAFQGNVVGMRQFRVRLSTPITGTGTVNVSLTPEANSTEPAVQLQGAVFTSTGQIPAAEGVNQIQTLNAATTVANGTTVDFGSPKQQLSFNMVTSAGVTAGAVTLQVSQDGTNWATPPTAAVATMCATAAANPVTMASANLVVLFSIQNANVRYARVNVSTNFTGGSVSAWVAAAG